MAPDKITAIIAGIVGIIFTYWFFLLKKDEIVEVDNSVDILVKGGYSPDTIQITKGKKTQINFLRKDPSTCLEEVVLSDFKIRKYLPINQKVSILIKPEKAGIYNFVCGMNMFHGKIIVK